MEYISIGMQCIVADVVKGPRFPFDVMLSTPASVHALLKLLMVDNMPVETIVREHFFGCTRRTRFVTHEQYVDDESARLNFNEKYSLLFPHEGDDHEANVAKYIRRFERLHERLQSRPITFVYASQSSSREGNYMVNGEVMIKETYKHLRAIADMLGSVKLLVFDSLLVEHKDVLHHPSITLVPISPSPNLYGTGQQLRDYFHRMMTNAGNSP